MWHIIWEASGSSWLPDFIMGIIPFMIFSAWLVWAEISRYLRGETAIFFFINWQAVKKPERNWGYTQTKLKEIGNRAAYQGMNINRMNTNRAAYQGMNINRMNTNRAAYQGMNINRMNTNRAAYQGMNINRMNTNRSAYQGMNINRMNTNRSAYQGMNINRMNTNRAAYQGMNPYQGMTHICVAKGRH